MAVPLAVIALLASAGYMVLDDELYGVLNEEQTTYTVYPDSDEAANAGFTVLDGVDHRRGGSGAGACARIGDVRPGQAIRLLFANHERFVWSYEEYPEEWRIEWEIVADNERLAEILYYHVLQMECILERGGTPRAWDPVFALESKLTPYIETEVELDGKTVRVTKTGENECAWEVIKLHAEVVKGFFENGWEEARKTHPIPEDVAEKCSDYLEEDGPK